MIATPSTNPTTETTIVQPPDLPISVYQSIVAGIAAAYPAQAARIARGLDTLMSAEIRTTDELGVMLVQTSSDARSYYRATGWYCCCPDRLRRPGPEPCKHSYAIVVLSIATAHAAWYRATGTRPADDVDPDAPIPYVVLAERQRARPLAGVGA